MMERILLLRASMDDYFPPSYYDFGDRHTNRFSNTTYNSQFKLFDCLFHSLESKLTGLYGGAIYISSTQSTLFMGRSTIFNCSSWVGGGIYFSSNSGELILHRLCASNCYVYNGQGQMLYVRSITKAFMCSITECGTKWFPDSRDTISCGNNILLVENLNCSFGVTYSNSGLYCYSSSTSFIKQTIQYSTFVGNKMGCLLFIEQKYDYSIRNTNFIGNENNDYGLVFLYYANVGMNRCCFNLNTGRLFYMNYKSCYLELANCMINHTGSVHSGSGSYGFFIISPMNETQEDNTHYASFYCAQRVPETPNFTPHSTPKLTPIRTPHMTPLRTPILTPKRTPLLTPLSTPFETPSLTIESTPDETPHPSPQETLSETPAQSPDPTPESTISSTAEPSPESTPDLTPGPTPSLYHYFESVVVVISSTLVVSAIFYIYYMYSPLNEN